MNNNSSFIPGALAELRQMEYLNLSIVCVTVVVVVVIIKLPAIIKASKVRED